MRIISLAVVLAASPVAADVLREQVPADWLAGALPETRPPVRIPAYFNDLDAAAARLEAGQYRHARMVLTALPAGERRDDLLARATAATGDVEAALTLAADPLTRGEILIDARRFGEAVEVLTPAKDRPAARFYLGHALEMLGRTDKARGLYAEVAEDAVARWRADPGSFEDAAELSMLARVADRWATLSGAYEREPALHDAILAMHVRTYDVLDRDYWRGRLATAQFLAARSDLKQAESELRAALSANPSDVDTLSLLGATAVDRYQFEQAERVVRELRGHDPDSPAAALSEVRLLLKGRQAAEALAALGPVEARFPDDLEVLGLKAGALDVLLRDAEADAVLARADELAPGAAGPWFEAGAQLDNLRQYDRGEARLREAIARAPWWTQPRNTLAILLTQSGKENAAREVIEAARVLDPFNAATLNYANLLDQMAGFARHETEHFVIVYDEALDAALVPHVAEVLEAVHPEQVERFGHEPDRKTQIQFFPRHDQFSVRIAGDPFIGTVGACTGPVIAMVSPGDDRLGTYDWAEVLRHEYAHTITLGATGNRIPHWLTEGLAVTEEPGPLRWRWVPMLAGAVGGDELFGVDELTWGFIRPRRPGDRSLAYAQSGWLSEYIAETWGDEAVRELLEAFKDGLTEAEAIERVLGESPGSLRERFEPWAQAKVDPWGHDEATTEDYTRLLPAAEAATKARRWDEALELWEELRRLRPDDALPAQRLAGVYLRPEVGRRDEGIDLLLALHERAEDDNRYGKLAANLLHADGRLDEAIAVMEKATHIDFYDEQPHAKLADWHAEAGDAARAELFRDTLQKVKASNARRASERL